jgi:hypothetical protein
MSARRSRHTATLLPDGRVLVAGGFNGLRYLKSTEVYDPLTGTWAASGSMAAARYLHTATGLPDGRVLVAGGFNRTLGPVTDVEIYDPVAGTWSGAGDLVAARFAHTAVRIGTMVLVVGGFDQGTLASAELGGHG